MDTITIYELVDGISTTQKQECFHTLKKELDTTISGLSDLSLKVSNGLLTDRSKLELKSLLERSIQILITLIYIQADVESIDLLVTLSRELGKVELLQGIEKRE